MDVQTDIFGNEIPVDELKSSGTIKGRFRAINGFDEGHRCEFCRYLCLYRTDSHTYYKCNMMGISSNEETDISPNDPACKKYEERK